MTDPTAPTPPPAEAEAPAELASITPIAKWRKGIDDSSWDHPRAQPIDYAAVVADGITWVAVKLTEGGEVDGQPFYVNPYAGADVGGFRSQGVEPAAYHFFRPAAFAPAQEAAVFAAACAKAGIVGAAERWLDLEDGLEQLGAEALATAVRTFIVGVDLTGVYTEESYYEALLPFGFPWGLKLWLAIPGFDPATEAPPDGAAIVQYNSAAVPGIGAAAVDLDAIYYGTEAEPEPAGPPSHVVVLPPGPAAPVEPTTTVDLGQLGTISAGHSGTPVRKVQALLTAAGVTLAVDGVFGPITTAAVSSFQSVHQLTVDGVVGPLTWRALILA